MSDFILLGSVGAISGLLAGLFGIGGAVVVVPALIFFFELSGMGELSTKFAIGTSFASILFTGLSSSFTHYKRKAIDCEILYSIAPFIILGTFIGATIAGKMDGPLLKIFFGFLEIAVAIIMFFRIYERETYEVSAVWKWAIYIVGGVFIGTIASLLGIGGGTMIVPLLVLLLYKRTSVAIGTASAIGVIISFFGTIGFIYQGRQYLSDMTFGFVVPQTALLIGIAGATTAPIGAMVAHRIDTLILSRLFSFVLIVIGLLLIVP
ncbi:MAG: sulfite exporter TauE/SafE family protein [Nitrospirota bacterium]